MSITPLGRPVVPPVPTIIARSSTDGRSTGSRRRGARNSVPGQCVRDRRRRGRPRCGRLGGRRGSRRPAARTTPGRSAPRSRTASSSSRFSAASLRGLIGHHTAPAREIPKTQVNATGSLADRIATLAPGRCAAGRQRPGDASGRGRAPRRRTGRRRPWSGRAGPVPATRPCRGSRPAAPRSASTVSTGSETSPKPRSTPSSSRCPNAWQPDAKPTRRGGCWSREYAAYACSSPVCL